jgi:transposase
MPNAVPLPTTLAECHAKLLEQQAAIATQQATIDEQQTILEAMQGDLAALKRMVFGQRRERFEDPRQGTLFDSLFIGDASEEDESDKSKQDEPVDEETLPDAGSSDEDTATASRRKGRGRRVFPKCLPREKRVRKLTDEEIPAALRGTNFRRFLKKVGEWIDYRPPSMTVIEEYIEVVAADNADATETTMITAPRPERILNCFAGPSLLAGLAVNHFSDHLPYYRLEDILQRSQLVIDRSTQCRWMIRLAKKLTPLTDLMRMLALESPVVQADETPVKMPAKNVGSRPRQNVDDLLVGDPW